MIIYIYIYVYVCVCERERERGLSTYHYIYSNKRRWSTIEFPYNGFRRYSKLLNNDLKIPLTWHGSCIGGITGNALVV